MVEEEDFLLTKKERVQKYVQQYCNAIEDKHRDNHEYAYGSFCEDAMTPQTASSLHVARPTVCSEVRRRESFASMSASFQANVPSHKRWRLSFNNSLKLSKDENDSTTENHFKQVSLVDLPSPSQTEPTTPIRSNKGPRISLQVKSPASIDSTSKANIGTRSSGSGLGKFLSAEKAVD